MGINEALAWLLGLTNDRFALIDVGARWGAHKRWAPMLNRADIVCFEPEPTEAQRLQAEHAANVRYMPCALAASEGPRELYVTRDPACSSLFAPIQALVDHYAGLAVMEYSSTVTVACRRLDDVLAELGISRVAAIKLDTQGAELEILHGAVKTLETCALVDIEVEFNPLYHGQALFCDVDRFLRDHGFVLWRIENISHYSAEGEIPDARADILISIAPHKAVGFEAPNGQLFWAQAQYVRASYPRTGAAHMSFSEAIEPACIAAVYGFWDLTVELIRKTERDDILSELRARLRPRAIPA